MLTKQLECNAELLKAMERRGMLDENDKVIFNHASDREEYRRLKAERKALLERTRPQN
jgi:cell division protein FtsL